MEKLRILASLLTTILLLGSSALPQTADSQTTNARAHLIAAARCQYTADNVCAAVSDPTQAGRNASDDTTLTQLPRRGPGPPFRPRGPMGYPRPNYSPLWMNPDDGHRAAIGTLIGFGLGAAAGAGANTDARGRVAASLLAGSIGALLGAAVGHVMPVFHVRRPYDRGPWPDEDELAARGTAARPDRTQRHSPQQTASASSARSTALPNAEDSSAPAVAAP